MLLIFRNLQENTTDDDAFGNLGIVGAKNNGSDSSL